MLVSIKQKLILYLISCEPGIKDIYSLVKVFDKADFPSEMTENLNFLIENHMIKVEQYFENGSAKKYKITETGRGFLKENFIDTEVINYIKTMDNQEQLLLITQTYLGKENGF